MNMVKTLGLLFAQLKHLCGADVESRLFDFIKDGAGFPGFDGIRF
jgi:hypothetical protein